MATDDARDESGQAIQHPRVVDLFCGAGGASAGMWQAGAELVAGVDQNEDALETHAANLPGEHVQHDLADVDPAILPTTDVDWVHGSPPCQGFSQAKGERDPDDERNQLVWRFIEWVDAIRPKVVTMENVAGMQTISDHFLEQVCGHGRDGGRQQTLVGDVAHAETETDGFASIGYEARWRCLNAADYGVPQTRERIIVVAVREDIPTPDRWFPEPTHEPHEYRTVRDAIGDLAAIEPGANITSQQNEAHQKAGRRPFHTAEEPARTIRCGTPPEVETDGGVPNHEPEPLSQGARAYLSRGKSLSKHAPNTLPEPARTIPANIKRGVPYGLVEIPNHEAADHDDSTREWMATLPLGFTGDSVTTRRLDPAAPSGAITGSSATPPVHYQGANPDDVADAPSCTVTSRGYLRERGHHDSISDGDVRRLTVREAARLPSFGDWFVFEGCKTHQLEQVGNAVPPRLQQHITANVRQMLGGEAVVA